MRRDSIFFSITLFFGVAFLSVFMLFTLLIQVEYDSYKAQTYKRFSVVERILSIGLQQGLSRSMLAEQVKSVNFHILEDFSRIKDIKEVVKHHSASSEIMVLQGDRHRFVKIDTDYGSLMLEDMEPGVRFPLRLYSSLGIALGILVVVYFIVVRRLRPLSQLRLKIRRFANGERNISTAMDAKDEIADVANEFDNLIRKLGELDESRQLFLRNIMHELKTPLTKGRISAEMLQSGKNKERLIQVFSRMDLLIDQMGRIEQLTSGYLRLHPTDYRFVDILEHALDLLMADKSSVQIVGSELNLRVDYELFSLAVKNLLDNALKYSPDRRVTVDAADGRICFCSRGDALKEPLEYYTTPFSRDSTHTKEGMGLGLYITRAIIDKHGFALSYRRKEEKNCFVIEEV